jgi:hypothetical protein
MEDARVLRQGEGVAYEYLWANPYLPGVSYYNLDPWSYDPESAVLYARSSWDLNACWIRLDASGIAEQNCPEGWREKPFAAGHLDLIPFHGGCFEVPGRPKEESPGDTAPRTIMLWGLPPKARMTYKQEGKTISRLADNAGLFVVPENREERVCLAGAGDRPQRRN